jgi:hypothetical protein
MGVGLRNLGNKPLGRYWALTKNKDMVSGRLFRQILDKFIKSPVGGDARVQVVLPNGQFYDITGAQLMENKLIGVRESHRILLTVEPERAQMGKVLKKL